MYYRHTAQALKRIEIENWIILYKNQYIINRFDGNNDRFCVVSHNKLLINNTGFIQNTMMLHFFNVGGHKGIHYLWNWIIYKIDIYRSSLLILILHIIFLIICIIHPSIPSHTCFFSFLISSFHTILCCKYQYL